MPVKFEAESEYDRQFKWLNSKTSPLLQASPGQKAPIAGVKSVEAGLPLEPQIQRRKKPSQLSRTLPAQFHDTDSVASFNEDEFFLLGDTSKFADNVQYRNSRKALKQKLAKGKTYKINIEPEKREKTVCELHAPEHESKPREPVEPLRIQQPMEALKLRETAAKKAKSPEKQGTKRAHSGRPKRTELERTSPKKTPDAPRQEARRPPTTQTVQTEKHTQDKKVAEKSRANQEAPADLALQHRAGMKPERVPTMKRLSEYQKQFQWKDGVVSSPLLAADQIVHKSASVLKPHVTLPRHSEYQVQYQQPPKNVYTAPSAPKPDGASPNKIPKPAPVPAPEPAKKLTEKERRLLNESSNPQKPFAPHGKHRRTKSEYASNFKSPQAYVYADGSWKGARTAQVNLQNAAEKPDTAQSWYQEVLELRQKAEEYRKRALGTHFSRMHTAQVLARNAELWDTESEESRTVSALSLETGSRASSRRPIRASTNIIPGLETGSETGSERPRPRNAWANDRDDSVPLSSASHRSLYDSESEAQTITPRDSTPRAPREDEDETESDEGRVPTPRLKVHPSQHQQRHHLDKTTPSVGGALLTSPPAKLALTREEANQSRASNVVQREDARRLVRSSQPSVRQHHRHGYELDVQCTCGASDHEEPRTKAKGPKISPTKPQPQPSTSGVRRSFTPTFGRPTSDRQPLLDEEASVDRVLTTKYIPGSRAQDGARVDRVGLEVPRTIDERFGDTYISPQRRQTEYDDDDDDALSTSMRSIASSCSVASDTLERARQRRDHFWGRDHKKVGTA